MRTGVGLYIRGLDKKIHGTPKQAAQKAKDHGISFVAILAAWQQYSKALKFFHAAPNAKNGLLQEYADAFRAVGIEVGAWFYPWGGHEEQLLDTLHQIRGYVSFFLDDGELGHKWVARAQPSTDKGMQGQPEAIKGVPPRAAKTAVLGQVQALYSGLDALELPVGVTSYGFPKGHKNFPWDLKLNQPIVKTASPQFYTTDPQRVDDGIWQWVERLPNRWPAIVPSIPTFGKNSGDQLHNYLSAFVTAKLRIDGFIAWSWRQTSRAEWNVLARWSEWLERGACQL